MIAIMIVGFIKPPVSLSFHGTRGLTLLPSSPLNEADYHNDNGNHQKDMDDSAHRVAGHQPQQPENYQYYSNCP